MFKRFFKTIKRRMTPVGSSIRWAWIAAKTLGIWLGIWVAEWLANGFYGDAEFFN